MLIAPEFEFYSLDQVSYECSPNKVFNSLNTPQAEWNKGIGHYNNSG